MKFDNKQKGRKNPRDKSFIKLLNSPAIMASGISTTSLSSYPNELYNTLKLLLQEKPAGNNSNITNDEIIAIVDKLLEIIVYLRNNIKKI